ncbi:MAG: hypothetical protein R6W77_03480 [Trueperaceae bacterium]
MTRPGTCARLPGRLMAGVRARSRRAAGLTIVETLVALAIAAIALVGFASLVANARTTAVTTVVSSDASRALDLAAALLSEEVRLAGGVPWPRPERVEGTEDPEAFVTTALWLDAGSAADGNPAVASDVGASVRLRYVDARLAGAPLARDVTFEVGVDARGVPQLYRRADGAARQPLVEGVGSLRLVGVVEDGLLVAPPVAGTFRPSALLLEVVLDAAWAQGAGSGAGPASGGAGGGGSASSTATEREPRLVVVALPNRPATIVTTALNAPEATP